MKNFLLALFAIFVLLSCESGKLTNEYHVSMTGSDDNPGSESLPFRTISAAASLSQPGDVITVHEGIYRERIDPPRGGTSDDNRIVYQAYPGEKVVIKGSEHIKDWKKVADDTWEVKLSNSFFGGFNPYSDVISGNWFHDNKRTSHTGAVYLNGHWLNEAVNKSEVFGPLKDTLLWYATVDESETTIWAQFDRVNPNHELVEINVRQTVFYPEEEGICFITVRGFKLEQAATPWAPPTHEQIGLIGPHWSKGWIIENNEICYSVCTGVSLGKYEDESDYHTGSTSRGYVETIDRAREYNWSKDNIGSHIVRNNHIHHCEQAGIVGSLGAIFCTIQGNEIHDIHVKRLFSGMEMGGIKIHGGIDMLIANNYIHHCWRGLWLDWMAQGTRVTGNLLHDNNVTQDVFVEVNHGPVVIDNNILLSPMAMFDLSQGSAFVHNLFLGKFIPRKDDRVTPFHKEHSTELAGSKVISGGDDRYYNNIFMSYNQEAQWPDRMGLKRTGNFFGLGAYNPEEFPLTTDGNDYVDKARAFTGENDPVVDPQFTSHAEIVKKEDGIYLEVRMNRSWLIGQRLLVTTELLGKAENPDLPFVQPDGKLYVIDNDFLGMKRYQKNPAPGPFENIIDGLVSVKVVDRL